MKSLIQQNSSDFHVGSGRSWNRKDIRKAQLVSLKLSGLQEEMTMALQMSNNLGRVQCQDEQKRDTVAILDFFKGLREAYPSCICIRAQGKT